MEKPFETEVLTRLAVIESKLDDYQNIKEKAELGYTIAMRNKEDVSKLQDNNKWLFRTTVGACITSLISIMALILKIGLGVS